MWITHDPRARSAFRTCAAPARHAERTDGEGQHYLAQGLKQLRAYFLVKAVLWVLGFLLCCCGIILAMTMGAAIFSVLAGAAASQ